MLLLPLSRCYLLYAVKELFAITPTFRLVSPSIAGGVATLSTTYAAGYAASNAIDMRADPSNSTSSPLAHGSCPSTTGSDWFRLAFPPVEIASYIFVNRGDGGFGTRIVQGAGYITLSAQNGTQLDRRDLSAQLIQQFSVTPFLAPQLPNPTAPDQTDETNRNLRVRYLRIVAPANVEIRLREIWLLDWNLVNIAYGRTVTSSSPPTVGNLSAVVDGVLDFDLASTTTGSQVTVPGSASGASLTIDLGGLYEPRFAYVFLNQFNLPSASYTMQLLNHYGWPVGAYTVGNIIGQSVQLWSLANTTYPPSPSATSTRSNSATASVSATPSSSATASLPVGVTPSITKTASATPSLTASPVSVHPVRLKIDVTGQPLNFIEALVFNTAGKLISAQQNGGVASSSADLQASFNFTSEFHTTCAYHQSTPGKSC